MKIVEKVVSWLGLRNKVKTPRRTRTCESCKHWKPNVLHINEELTTISPQLLLIDKYGLCNQKHISHYAHISYDCRDEHGNPELIDKSKFDFILNKITNSQHPSLQTNQDFCCPLWER